MTIDKGNRNRLLIVGVLALILMMFVLVNVGSLFRASIIYILIIAVSLVLMVKGSNYIGIDRTVTKDIIIGAIVGVGFILLSFTGLSIGVPDVPQSIDSTGQFLTVGVVAPVGEELLFRGLLQGLLLNVIQLAPLLGILVQAILFSIFHLTAYGSVAVNTGAFVGAGLFGLVAGLLAWRTKSILPGIVAHAMFNIFLLTKLVIAI